MKNFFQDIFDEHPAISVITLVAIVILAFSFIGANFINFHNTTTSFVPSADADVIHTYTVTSKEVGGKYGDIPYAYYVDEEGNGGRTSLTTAQYATMNVGDQFYQVDLGTNYWVNFFNLIGWAVLAVIVLAILGFVVILIIADA